VHGAGPLVRANGWLAQCGASGSLLGPPLMAACVQAGGWRAAAVAGLLMSIGALACAWRATPR
jgi:MFS transporter, CP family, cyanate transporter